MTRHQRCRTFLDETTGAACTSPEASGCETVDGRVCRCACHDATVTPDSAHRAADALGLHIVAADGAEVRA